MLFTIVRSKESLIAQHGVRGPLLGDWGEECAANANCVFESMGEHRLFLRGGRATFVKSWWNIREFDVTRGFSVEDILPPPLH